VAHVINPQKAQQKKWRKSPGNALQQRAFEYCGKGVSEKADLFELGWSNGEVIVSYLTCEDYRRKEHHIAEDRGQEVVKRKEWEELKKCRECAKKGKEKTVCPTKEKAQQKKRAVKEVQRTFKMLKEVWLDIGIERTDTHKNITIKALLDSGAMGMFMDRKTAAKHGFRL